RGRRSRSRRMRRSGFPAAAGRPAGRFARLHDGVQPFHLVAAVHFVTRMYVVDHAFELIETTQQIVYLGVVGSSSAVPEQQQYALHGMAELHYRGKPERTGCALDAMDRAEQPVYNIRALTVLAVLHRKQVVLGIAQMLARLRNELVDHNLTCHAYHSPGPATFPRAVPCNRKSPLSSSPAFPG